MHVINMQVGCYGYGDSGGNNLSLEVAVDATRVDTCN